MDRRQFLKTLGVAAGALLLPPAARAEIDCGPWQEGVQLCTVGIRSEILDLHVLPVGKQRASQWCWAACIETVFHYYGYSVPQERIVAETWGDIVDMPADAYTILGNLNRTWSADDGRPFQSYGDSLSANLYTALEDLRGDQPLIIGTMGHAMLLTAISYVHDTWGNFQVQAATVRDPMPGNAGPDGKRLLTPQEWYNVQFLARIRVEGY